MMLDGCARRVQQAWKGRRRRRAHWKTFWLVHDEGGKRMCDLFVDSVVGHVLHEISAARGVEDEREKTQVFGMEDSAIQRGYRSGCTEDGEETASKTGVHVPCLAASCTTQAQDRLSSEIQGSNRHVAVKSVRARDHHTDCARGVQQLAADVISAYAAGREKRRNHEEQRGAARCLQSCIQVVNLVLRAQAADPKSTCSLSGDCLIALLRSTARALQARIRSEMCRRKFSQFRLHAMSGNQEGTCFRKASEQRQCSDWLPLNDPFEAAMESPGENFLVDVSCVFQEPEERRDRLCLPGASHPTAGESDPCIRCALPARDLSKQVVDPEPYQGIEG
eukprot:753858-Hanusia_phi.AAC.11